MSGFARRWARSTSGQRLRRSPSQSQLDRISELGKELAAVVADFDTLSPKEIAAANAALAAKGLAPVKLLTKADWEKPQTDK